MVSHGDLAMSALTNELHALIEAYRISETPTDALALADFLSTQTRNPYLVEDRKDGMVYAFETLDEARQYADVCIDAQAQPKGETPFGVNHKTRKLMFVDEQSHWQSTVRGALKQAKY